MSKTAQAGACIVQPPNSLRYICDSDLPEGYSCFCPNQSTPGRTVEHFDPFGGHPPQDACAVLPAPKKGPIADEMQEFCINLAACRHDVKVFTECSQKEVVLPEMQQELVQCAENSTDQTTFAQCAGAMVLGKALTPDQQKAVTCITKSSNADAYVDCLGDTILYGHLSDEQRAVLDCGRASETDLESMASCVGAAMIGDKLSNDQQIALKCAGEAGDEITSFATCEAAAYSKLPVNAEQRIALECVASSGGQPYAAAACTATALTLRELEKCAKDGIGGHGCFGDTNDLVGRDGWTVRTIGNALGDLEHGPGPHNDLFGGQGFAGRTLEDIRQHAPPPLTFGTVAGHRVCIPWC